ncbi:MAG: hypothetical protein ABR599_03485 [Gemmatimonadota bacterium]
MQHLERSVATLLYTDIVGSTERLAQLGDRGYRKLRSAHDARVRRELRRFGGRELSTSGDGFLARFEEPAPAIACAAAIRDSVRDVGLEIRQRAATPRASLHRLGRCRFGESNPEREDS